MTNPFHIESSEIEQLSPEQLPRIMNRLLRAEAADLALPVEAVETSLHITDPDGGIDARVHNTSTSDRKLPAGESVWQFKAMKRLSAQEMRKEAMKPAVRSAMETGAMYCLSLGGDPTPAKYAALKEQLIGIANKLYPGASCRLLTAGTITDWAAI